MFTKSFIMLLCVSHQEQCHPLSNETRANSELDENFFESATLSDT